MEQISYDEYHTMCEALGTFAWVVIHNATQKAFGSVSDVKQYYEKGLVEFVNGEKWIFNFNKMYPTFYRVDIKSEQFKKAY